MKAIASFVILVLATDFLVSADLIKPTRVRGGLERSNESMQTPRKLTQQDPCTLIYQETQFFEEDSHFRDGSTSRRLKKKSTIEEKKEWVCELSPQDAAMAEESIVRIEGITDEFIQTNHIESGESTILGEDATIEGTTMVVHDVSLATVGVSEAKQGGGDRRLAAASRTVLVVRVGNTNDGQQTSASASQLVNDIFDDAVSLRTHYAACSYGQLTLTKATGNNINNGVVTVNLASNTNGADTGVVRNQMHTAADAAVGKSISTSFDHVMFCIPPGTVDGGKTNWFAYAGVNSWFSVYNDDACRYVSAQMHEIGHNFGLAHSDEGGETYRDQTCMMGISYGEDDTRMCFNPVKSWQLGWYADRRKLLNPISEAPFQANMIGVATYGTASGNDLVLLRIDNAEPGYDFYVGYNYQSGINQDAKEGGNAVTVTKREANTSYKTSSLQAKLGVGGTYKINNFQNTGKNLIIRFTSRTSGFANVLVDVFFEGFEGVFPTAAPTQPCNNGEVYFLLDLKLDYYAPEDNSWKIVHDSSGSQIASGGNYPRNAQDVKGVCLNSNTDYTFTFYDNFGDGICCNQGEGEYVGYLDSAEIFRYSSFTQKEMISKFKTGTGPTKPPTKPPTKAPTKAPTPPPVPSPTNPPPPSPTSPPNNGSCPSDKASFTLDIKFDYWAPEDNTWSLKDSAGTTIDSGSNIARNAEFSKTYCLTKGSAYKFRLDDVYGDSICCQHGQGFYKGKLSGNEIFSGGEGFGKVAQHDFVVPAGGSCSQGQSDFKLKIQLDYWGPEDNSWNLIDSFGNVKGSGKNLGRNQLIEETMCLQTGVEHKFRLDDVWGDGICCAHGDGYYEGILKGSQIFAGGNDVGKSVEKSFTA